MSVNEVAERVVSRANKSCYRYKLTTVTVGGSIKVEWVNSAAAGTSLFGGRVIIRRGMCMYIETESLS